MPTTIYFPENAKRTGISVRYTKTKKLLSISGWYDGGVGIEPTTILLSDFLYRLGISGKDCVQATQRRKNAK